MTLFNPEDKDTINQDLTETIWTQERQSASARQQQAQEDNQVLQL